MPLRTPCLYYDPKFLCESEANEAYQDLLDNTPWEKTAKINRWVTLMELPKDGGEGKGDANDNDNNEGETTGKEEGRGYIIEMHPEHPS